jgi:cysteinyl-tRNA synthetase
MTTDIRFYNTLHHRVETFQPLEPSVVRMYSCGPTVYDFAHIGNFRTFLFGDMLRRFLELMGYRVHHVMNITDVGHMTVDDVADGGGEDKMQLAMRKMKEDKKSGRVPEGAIDNPDDPYQVARYFTEAFLEDARKLAYKVAFDPQNLPRATDHIAGMQRMIARLVDRGHAYVASDGVVYYSVESFDRYGQLSGNTIDRLQTGAGGRVSEENQLMKRHPGDFLLWKPDAQHLMKWDSPWGTGYPGWHIECSVMAMELLGRNVIDIHTGGEDLIFPHHECEIAQSCGATGEEHFARYWVHARFLFVEGEKMSKSKGNFFTARDVFSGRVTGREVHPAVLRFELIKSHYRDNLNFTKKGLMDSANSVRRLQEFRQSLEAAVGGQAVDVDLSHPILAEFTAALADDLNISGALGAVLPWVGTRQADPGVALGVLKKINSVLGVAPITEGLTTSPTEFDGGDARFDEALDLCRQIDRARADRDFSKADQLRKRVLDLGFEVRTTKEGTTVQRTLA